MGRKEKIYLVGWRVPVSEAKVVFLQQVDMVTHLRQKLLAFSVFLHHKERHKAMKEGGMFSLFFNRGISFYVL